ncbi:MAG: hypothetical protein FJY74_02180 [Candidatus Eisenbacteria bacterium]|nr:hypothetical protein [Candidatus Eisenbacteria bacterium]
MNMTLIGTTLAALLTIAVYSFLYKDNPFYKFAEHLVVGVSAGYYLVIYYYNFIDPTVVSPVFRLRIGGDAILLGGVDWWMALIPGLLGLILYARFFPKIGWVSRWALGIYVGGYSGLGIAPVMQARVLDQIRGGALPVHALHTGQGWTNLLLVVGLLGTLTYFFFSLKHKGVLGGLARIGIVFIMVGFGASFGYTVMSRVSLLIGRMNFLLHDWLRIV